MSEAASDRAGRALRGLLGLAFAAALSQALIQTQAFTHNPDVLVPGSDAGVIWERAGRVAAGELVGDAPFDTAPLPLWTAALVRAAGGGLAAVGVLQSLMLVAAVVLVAEATRALVLRVADVTPAEARSVGLVGGALLLLTEDAAATTSRVLGGSLQLVLGALWLVLALRARGTKGAAAALGLVNGLLCLAFPPALGLVPVTLWLVRRPPMRALLALVATAAAIAPATFHNLRASGEVIAISSQSGLTFFHGNNPSADGTIAPVGVVNAKESQALDSLERAREVLGPDAGWNRASAHWRDRGLAWWADSPGAALRVAGRKLWYALSGRHYGDVFQSRRERADGTSSRLWLAPLPVAWLVFPALFAGVGLAVGCRRRAARALPALALAALPIAVVVVYFYTPRYRLPALPALAPLAALALVQARAGGRPALLAGVSVLIGIASGPFNRAIGFDVDPGGSYANLYAERMALASGRLGWHDRGAAYLAALLEERPDDAALRGRLATLHWRLRADPHAALAVLDAAPAPVAPTLVLARARILARGREAEVADPAEAVRLAEALLAAHGEDPYLLEVRAAALARAGEYAEATSTLRRAIDLLPEGEEARRAQWRGFAVDYSEGQPPALGPVPDPTPDR